MAVAPQPDPRLRPCLLPRGLQFTRPPPPPGSPARPPGWCPSGDRPLRPVRATAPEAVSGFRLSGFSSSVRLQRSLWSDAHHAACLQKSTSRLRMEARRAGPHRSAPPGNRGWGATDDDGVGQPERGARAVGASRAGPRQPSGLPPFFPQAAAHPGGSHRRVRADGGRSSDLSHRLDGPGGSGRQSGRVRWTSWTRTLTFLASSWKLQRIVTPARLWGGVRNGGMVSDLH